MTGDTNPDSGSAATANPIDAVAEMILDRTPEKEAPATLIDEDEDDDAAPASPEDDDEVPEETPDPADDEDDPAPEPDAKTWTLTVGGKPVEVTEAELLASYSRQADYTKKTTDLAEQRRSLEAEAARVAEERSYLAAQLQQYQQSLQIPPEPDARLIDSNPQEYLRQRAAWENGVRQFQQVQAEQQRLTQQSHQEQQEHYQRHLKSEMEKLTEALPDWKDERTAKQEKRNLTEYLRKIGYSDAEISSATDHRAIILARKAALWDKLQASKPGVEQKLQQAPRTLKPGATTPGDTLAQQRKSMWKNLERKGGIDAAAALIAMG